MIEQASIEELKLKINIIEVIGNYIKLKKDGANTVGICPFHDEKTPSFKVSATKGIYKCFGCGKTGDAIEFVKDYQKITFLDAVKEVAAFYNVPLLEQNNERKPKVRPVSNPLPLTMLQYEWFADRGIETKTLNEFKITNSLEWMPKAKGNVETICFNYYRGDELINVKYRAADKDFKLTKDAELIFYNLDAIKGKDHAIIVEGEMDCLSVSQCGMHSVVSVPNGAAKGVQKLEYLDNCWEYFKDIKEIVIATDGDECGMLLRDELARRLGIERCFKVNYPINCKDANEVLLKCGKEALRKMIAEAVAFPIAGVFTMAELYGDVENFYYHGYPKGVKAGIANLDGLISFMPGQFTTITGIPSSGKSEITDYILTELARNYGWSFGVCSFENQPASLHATKIMEKYTRKSFAQRINPYDRMNIDEFHSAVNFVNEYFNFINISQIEVTLQGILDKAKELVIGRGIKGLLIDPWNYIEHKSKIGQSETQYISECLTAIKAFALTNGVHVFLIAHPTKLPKEGNKYAVPTLYNISGSAHFFNKTDNGITVYRDFENKTVDVHVQKVRYSWLGEVGVCSFTYNIDTRQYHAINS